MKRFFLFAIIIALFGACQQKNLQPEPEPVLPDLSPDSTYVFLKTALDFSSEPLTKSDSQDGLYGIRVFQISQSGPILVAWGTFDDLSTAVVKMAKAYRYGIDVTFIPNGKQLVYRHPEGFYGVPFDNELNPNHGQLNQVMYCNSPDDPIHKLDGGAVREVGISQYGIEFNNWSTVTRYQGIAVCDPSKQESVVVKLYLQMISFHI